MQEWCVKRARVSPCRVYRVGGHRYLERYFLGQRFGVRAYLHRFISGDSEELLHHHPWAWSVSRVLHGGYIEDRLAPQIKVNGPVPHHFINSHISRRKLRAGRFNWLSRHAYHRIVEIDPGTWTLFIHPAKKVQQWCQLVPTEDQALVPDVLGSLSDSTWEKTCPIGEDHPDRAPWFNHT